MTQSFENFSLCEEVRKSLKELNFVNATPIQQKTIPILLKGNSDFMGMAATGTGKTAAFGIPLIEKIQPNKKVQAVILCPTRELAVQVSQQINAIGKHKKVSSLAIYGGTDMRRQIGLIRRAQHSILVATPGRLVDHLDRKNILLTDVKWLVLDEADKMLSMGFKEDLEYVISHIRNKNVWLFSATFEKQILGIANRYMKNPQKVMSEDKDRLPKTVEQYHMMVDGQNKFHMLCDLIDNTDNFYGLVFCETKRLVDRLTRDLRKEGYKADGMHGNKTQGYRERTLKMLKEKKINILVCTDVASRGLDINNLTQIVNFALPLDSDSYVHRIGRTARNGQKGTAFSFVDKHDRNALFHLERTIRARIPKFSNLPKGVQKSSPVHQSIPVLSHR